MVAEFDTTEQEYKLKEAEADLAEAEAHLAQAKAQNDAQDEEDRYALLKAESDVRSWRIWMSARTLCCPL